MFAKVGIIKDRNSTGRKVETFENIENTTFK